MTTINEIKADKDIVLQKLTVAEMKLKEFEEGENGWKWLEALRGKMRSEGLNEREEKQLDRLEEKEKRLEEEVKKWGDAWLKISEKKGNEQIA
jgi:hypothetical protein